MRSKSIVTIGFMTMMAVAGVVSASGSFASDVGSIAASERIGHGGSTYSSNSDGAGVCRMKADMAERIGAGGSTYSSSQTMSAQAGGCRTRGEGRNKVDVIERIGHGGSSYSFGLPMS
ncbi:MAG: hypothetical protein A4E19_05595 [Nitrospira sp. SG-bin1]|nr:MAG: hypothetical protein A4E19_05595 [Nitrospira sp. SG-bin1]